MSAPVNTRMVGTVEVYAMMGSRTSSLKAATSGAVAVQCRARTIPNCQILKQKGRPGAARGRAAIYDGSPLTCFTVLGVGTEVSIAHNQFMFMCYLFPFLFLIVVTYMVLEIFSTHWAILSLSIKSFAYTGVRRLSKNGVPLSESRIRDKTWMSSTTRQPTLKQKN